MSKTYVSLYDFTPRATGELRISKYDRILISDIGDGWAWGKNLSQGGEEGTFPRRYLAASRSGSSGFTQAVDEVATVCAQMDALVANSAYLVSEGHRVMLSTREKKLHAFGSFSYLSHGCAGRIWEECLHNFVSAFEGTKVKPLDYLRCVENLKRLSGLLNKCLPALVDEIRRLTWVLPSVLRNVECMQATLEGLVNFATAAFDLYKPKEPVKTCPLRLEHRSLTSMSGSTIRYVTSINRSDTRPLLNPTKSNPSSAKLLALSYPSLQALTILTCTVACCLQFCSYILSSHSPGATSEPDFYNNLQSVVMQLLTTYTGLVPAIRSKSVSGFVSVFWVFLLSVAGVLLALFDVGIYFHDSAMASLLGFFGDVVQAIVVLQLAIHMDTEAEMSTVLDAV
ncbi:unnamed protein product [Discula destructiva]